MVSLGREHQGILVFIRPVSSALRSVGETLAILSLLMTGTGMVMRLGRKCLKAGVGSASVTEVQRSVLEVKVLALGPLSPGSPDSEGQEPDYDPGCWASCALHSADPCWPGSGLGLCEGCTVGKKGGLRCQPLMFLGLPGMLLTLPLPAAGDKGRSGDHLQMPWRVWFLHGADLLAAASTLPRGGQTPETQIRDRAQGGQHHQ